MVGKNGGSGKRKGWEDGGEGVSMVMDFGA